MVNPTHGFSGLFVRHIPLSVLYASAELVKHDVDVEILDCRLNPRGWRDELRAKLSSETLLVGISVMSGKPIENAIEIGRLVKSIDPGIGVVWGGPHVTFSPDSTMQEPSCDFAIAGYGSVPLYELVRALRHGDRELDSIRGLSFRRGGEVVRVPELKQFEKIPYREIPYHLVPDYRVYGQLDSGATIFSMYSVLGCPYQCTFCSSPAQYRGTPGKVWVPLDVNEVVDHIAFVVEKYGAEFIYFIDDDSFVNLAHVEALIDGIAARGIKVKLGFRGARINEIKRMSHAYLTKLAEAGTDIMHIGAESGSDRILKLIKKNCTVDDILECNRKLAQHPEITVGYNFMMGLPSETMEEIHRTRDLWLSILGDNPRAIIFTPNKFRPLPGTELFDWAAKEWGYQPPQTLDDWINIELEADYAFPWYPDGMEQFCNMLFVTSYFLDNKIYKFSSGRDLRYRLVRLLSSLYQPIALWRLRHGFDRWLIEYPLYRLLTRMLVRLRDGAPTPLPPAPPIDIEPASASESGFSVPLATQTRTAA